MNEPEPTQPSPERPAESGPLTAVQRVVLGPLRRGNALEDTVARLVQTVRLGMVAPGASLPSERDLATRFGVSRDTVREAIRELTHAGIVVPKRGRNGGTFVADPLPAPEHPPQVDRALLDDVLGMRRVLEGGAAVAAASRTLSEIERATLRQHFSAACATTDPDYRRHDTLFHLTIAHLSAIPTLIGLIAENRGQINSWLDTFPLLPRNIEHSNDQHEKILQAIIDGDPEAAHAAMLDHLDGSEALLRGFLA